MPSLLQAASARRHALLVLLMPCMVLLIPASGEAGRYHGRGHRHHGHRHHGHRHFGFSLGRHGGFGLRFGFGHRHFPRYHSYSYPRYLGYSYAYPRYRHSYAYSYPHYGYSNAYAVPQTTSPYGADCLPGQGAIYEKVVPQQAAPKYEVVPDKELDSQENQGSGNRLPDDGAGDGDSGNGTQTGFKTATGRSPGWELLVRGRPASALGLFARDAERDLGNGFHKVGYSLAAAAAGDLSRGAWAMRRASRIDPTRLRRLEVDDIDPRLRRIVKQLAATYEDRVARRIDHANSAFMVAALHYLDGNDGLAQKSVEEAIGGGDRTVSTRNLHQAIELRLAARRERAKDQSVGIVKVANSRRGRSARRDLPSEVSALRLTPRIAAGREF